MEQIFSGKVYEILPTSNGIIFSYLNKELENGAVEVSYRMISFDNRRVTDVAKNIYMISKFGNGYKAVEGYCENYITSKSILIPGGRVFLLHEDGTARLVDSDGESLWVGSFAYRNFVPSDVLLYGEGLWCCYPEADALIKFSLTNMKQELRVGGKNSPFNAPCDLFEEEGRIVICNRDSKTLQSIDLTDYSILEYETFDEPLYQYVNLNGYRFVVLESGLYVI